MDGLDDRYTLGSLLGRGGACDVYRAHDERLRRDVAIKVLRDDGIGDARRMAKEARILASLDHPGVLEVFDVGEVDGRPFLVLELVEGASLADRFGEGPVPPDEMAQMGAALADALASVHARDVVHRDVSPRNILCGDDGRVRLGDFGIARRADEARLTTAAVALGTPRYMAPEQLLGEPATPAADVYALGLVLLEGLTGRPAFPGPEREAAIARLAGAPDVGQGVPDAWRSLLAAMTAVDPVERPTAVEARGRLLALSAVGDRSRSFDLLVDPMAATTRVHLDDGVGEVAIGAGQTAVLPRPEPIRSSDPRWRRRRLIALLAGLVLLTLAIGLSQTAFDDAGHGTPATTVPVAGTGPSQPTTTTSTTATSSESGKPAAKPEAPHAGKGHGKKGRG